MAWLYLNIDAGFYYRILLLKAFQSPQGPLTTTPYVLNTRSSLPSDPHAPALPRERVLFLSFFLSPK